MDLPSLKTILSAGGQKNLKEFLKLWNILIKSLKKERKKNKSRKILKIKKSKKKMI